jgi:hypothetical protein
MDGLKLRNVCWVCTVVLLMGCRPGRRIGFTHATDAVRSRIIGSEAVPIREWESGGMDE